MKKYFKNKKDNKAKREMLQDKEDFVNFSRDAQEFTSKGSQGVTVILNAYARPQYVYLQLEALKKQTIRPDEVWVWSNRHLDTNLYDFSSLCERVVVSNTNWKFWGRFSLGLMATSRYVAFLDDDIFPGENWFENCIKTMEDVGDKAILGGCGVRVPSEANGGYSRGTRYGWIAPNEQVEEVDLVGHSWFMCQEHIKYMWHEKPYTFDNGEDIHLGFMSQKYGGLKTLVPAHPKGNKHLWSSLPEQGYEWGGDSNASFKQNKKQYNSLRDDIVNSYRCQGWSVYDERQK